MARVKSDNNLTPLNNWEEVDLLVREIGNLQGDINRIEDSTRKKIDTAKANMADATSPLQEKIKEMASRIEAFAIYHKKDFVGKKRSKALNFGKVGWRTSFDIEVVNEPQTVELIGKVFKDKAQLYLKVKSTPNKNNLATLTDEQLAKVEAYRKKNEIFFVKPAIQEAVDYDEGRDAS